MYVFPVKFVVPSFLLTQLMAAFLRNDGNPGLATKAVLFGGIFNVFGDYFFVFILDMGIMGAGLATAMGSVFSLMVMVTHFRSKKNTLRLVKPEKLFFTLRSICVTGFSTFFIDVAMGILTMLFNRQILKYLGTEALSVYGIIINISTFVQCCAYSIGQASQPMISTNFGAGKGRRIAETLKYALGTAAVFGLVWTALVVFVPNLFVRIFMSPTDGILAIAPNIIRSYGISFLLLPFNIFSTYYFQALMEPTTSFIVSVSRGAIVSGILIYILPAVAEHEMIKQLALQGDCVIVGRCADVVCRDRNPLNIFVYADRLSKLQRCESRADGKEHLSEKEMLRKMRQIDKERAAYRELFTEEEWGRKESYHLCINTSGKEIKTLIPGIAEFVNAWFDQK